MQRLAPGKPAANPTVPSAGASEMCEFRPPPALARVQAFEDAARVGEQGRVAEVSLRHLTAAAGQEHRVDVELEVEPQATLRLVLADTPKDTHQRLGGGELRCGRLIAQPIAVWLRSRIRQPHAPAHALHGPEHLAGLPPCAVEQQDMPALPRGGTSSMQVRGKRRARWMEDPDLAGGLDGMSRESGGRKEACLALVDMTRGGERKKRKRTGIILDDRPREP